MEAFAPGSSCSLQRALGSSLHAACEASISDQESRRRKQPTNGSRHLRVTTVTTEPRHLCIRTSFCSCYALKLKGAVDVSAYHYIIFSFFHRCELWLCVVCCTTSTNGDTTWVHHWLLTYTLSILHPSLRGDIYTHIYAHSSIRIWWTHAYYCIFLNTCIHVDLYVHV